MPVVDSILETCTAAHMYICINILQ